MVVTYGGLVMNKNNEYIHRGPSLYDLYYFFNIEIADLTYETKKNYTNREKYERQGNKLVQTDYNWS